MAATISDDAFNLIVTEEDSGQAYYIRHYEHFEFPGGASGPTIAIGYDCGYVTAAEAYTDWSGLVDATTLGAIQRACGIRGELAQSFVRVRGSSVTITWDQAIKQFREREVPKWIKRVQAALPNTDQLSPDSLGAIVSLTYNRGSGGYNDPGPRYSEMRAIRVLMASENFSKIPAEFLAMRRLWPVGGDLWKRREHEAALFQKGLAA